MVKLTNKQYDEILAHLDCVIYDIKNGFYYTEETFSEQLESLYKELDNLEKEGEE